MPTWTKHLRLPYHAELSLLLTPYLVGAITLIFIPMVITIVMAFGHYDGVNPFRWAGWFNFQMVFADPLEYIALDNSLYFLRWSVPLRLLTALLLALLLSLPRRGVSAYRTAVYLPTVIPEVAYALVWLWIVNPLYGPLNMVLRAVGLPAPAWLVDPNTAKWVFVFMTVFQVGETFVVLLAGLKSISPALYDAASIDGASPWQAFWHITLPLLAPWLILLTLRDAVLSFQSTFTPSMLMTGGDPYYATLFLPLLIYEEAFDNFRLGIGAAMIVLMFLVAGLLVTLLFSLLPSTEVDYDV